MATPPSFTQSGTVAHRFLKSQKNPYEPEAPPPEIPQSSWIPEKGDIVKLKPEVGEKYGPYTNPKTNLPESIQGEEGLVADVFTTAVETIATVYFGATRISCRTDDLVLVGRMGKIKKGQKNPYDTTVPPSPKDQDAPYTPAVGDIVQVNREVVGKDPNASQWWKERLETIGNLWGMVLDEPNARMYEKEAGVLVEFPMPSETIRMRLQPKDLILRNRKKAQKNPYDSTIPETPKAREDPPGKFSIGDKVKLSSEYLKKNPAVAKRLARYVDLVGEVVGISPSDTYGLDVYFEEYGTSAWRESSFDVVERKTVAHRFLKAQKNPYEPEPPKDPERPRIVTGPPVLKLGDVVKVNPTVPPGILPAFRGLLGTVTSDGPTADGSIRVFFPKKNVGVYLLPSYFVLHQTAGEALRAKKAQKNPYEPIVPEEPKDPNGGMIPKALQPYAVLLFNDQKIRAIKKYRGDPENMLVASNGQPYVPHLKDAKRIVEDMERELYARFPKSFKRVPWSISNPSVT